MSSRHTNANIPKALKWTCKCAGHKKGLAGINTSRSQRQHLDDTERHGPLTMMTVGLNVGSEDVWGLNPRRLRRPGQGRKKNIQKECVFEARWFECFKEKEWVMSNAADRTVKWGLRTAGFSCLYLIWELCIWELWYEHWNSLGQKPDWIRFKRDWLTKEDGE